MKKIIPLTLLVLMSCGKSTDQLDVATPTTNAVVKTINEKLAPKNTLIQEEDLAAKSTVALTGLKGVYCSGTLISENLIVTASHCVSDWSKKTFFKKSKPVITLGTVVFKLNSSSETTKLNMEDIELYPVKDEKEQVDHDIAIVKFSGALPKGFKPVAILAPEYTIVGNTDLLLAGFGFTPTPTSYKTQIPFKGIDKNIMTLSQTSAKEDMYYGDAGGPAYLETKKELLLVGSTVGGLADDSEVYLIRVSAYKKFILDSAKKLKATAPVFKSPEE